MNEENRSIDFFLLQRNFTHLYDPLIFESMIVFVFLLGIHAYMCKNSTLFSCLCIQIYSMLVFLLYMYDKENKL